MAFVDSTINCDADRRGGDPEPSLTFPLEWLSGVRGWHLPLIPSGGAPERSSRRLRGRHLARLIADCPNRHEIKDFVADLTPSVARLDVFLPSTSDLDIIAP